MGLYWVLAWASALVLPDTGNVRSSCHPDATVLGQVRRGEAAEIRFALNGELGRCYKVSVNIGGRAIEGYLPASDLSAEIFEKQRQQAPATNAARSEPAPSQKSKPPEATGSGKDSLMMRASRLLSGNQPQQALELLEQAMREDARDPNLLAMAGMAAYQSDRVADAVDWWKQVVSLAPNPPVEKMLRKAERELEADRSSQRLIGIRFQFRYDDQDIPPDQARGLIPVLDNEYARISEQLGCRVEERLTVVIQSRDAYMRTTGAAEWSAGQYDGRIRIALLEPAPGERTRKAFAHEIVHACLARLGNWPAWLHEGLAQHLSGEAISPQSRAAVAEMIRSKAMPSLGSMGQTWSRLSGRHADVSYTAAAMAVELLFTHYGSDGVRSLLQSPEGLEQVTLDLDRRLRE